MATRNESPAVARHRLRVALRKAREATGLTQGQVAKQLEISLSKVNRIEAGEVTVSRADLQALLQLYAITEPERVKDLIEEARISRAKGWWDEPKYRENLTPAMIQLIQFEESAEEVRIFEPAIFPGVLQTSAYAEAVVRFWQEELTESQRATRVEVRTSRRERLLARDATPSIMVMLDESVLLRTVGGPAVMAEQLDQLVRLGREPNVTIRLLPLAETAPLMALGGFHLWELGGRERVLYRESHMVDEIVHSKEKIDRHQRAFENAWRHAWPEEKSRREIEAKAAAHRAAIEHP